MGQWAPALNGNPGDPFSLILKSVGGGNLAFRMRIGAGAPVEGQFARAGTGGGKAPQTAAAAPKGEFKAGSWGGVVRSGPGMDFARVTSLPEGEPITVVANTGVVMNGYPWFKIRYRGKTTGFHWGGIMCAIGAPVTGLYEICPKTASATKAAGKPQPAAAGDVIGPVDYNCDEGIPLRVTYDNRGATSIATVIHDNSLTVRLPQVVSGSGTRYSDGRYTLQGKGKSAIFSWGDGQHSCTEN
jgi:membrane-bound inhibitor of C-type lysozyme